MIILACTVPTPADRDLYPTTKLEKLCKSASAQTQQRNFKFVSYTFLFLAPNFAGISESPLKWEVRGNVSTWNIVEPQRTTELAAHFSVSSPTWLSSFGGLVKVHLTHSSAQSAEEEGDFHRFYHSHSPSKLLTGLVRNSTRRSMSWKQSGQDQTGDRIQGPTTLQSSLPYTCLLTLMIDKSSKLSHTVSRKILKYLTSLAGLAAVWPGIVSCVVSGGVRWCAGSRWSSSTGQVWQHQERERTELWGEPGLQCR